MSPGYILATPGRFVRSMTTIGRRYPFIEVKNPAGAFTIALPAAHTETPFDFVKKLRNCDFAEATAWLASRYGRTVPSPRSTKAALVTDTRADGLELARKTYCAQTEKETGILSNWAKEGGYNSQFLKEAEVFAALGNKLTRTSANDDREAADAFEAAGLILRGVGHRTRVDETQFLPIEIPARDLFSTTRIVFTVRDTKGRITGFAGRAVGDEQPKYLFSRGFPRVESLYRIEHVISQVRTARARAKTKLPAERLSHLILVEGLVDALRLESLGLPTAAILGNRLTAKQAELIVELASQWERSGTPLAVAPFSWILTRLEKRAESPVCANSWNWRLVTLLSVLTSFIQ